MNRNLSSLPSDNPLNICKIAGHSNNGRQLKILRTATKENTTPHFHSQSPENGFPPPVLQTSMGFPNSETHLFQNMQKYFEFLENRIQNILLRPENIVLTYDILDTEKSKTNKLIVLKEKQRQMKVGEIWQEVLGNYDGYINLRIGHETGLDILSHTKKIAIELKNRTNTDNHSSKKSNLDKLAKFKMEHPDYTCIYGNINDNTEKKTMTGSTKKILHNGVEIQHRVGYTFIKYILQDDTDDIINFVRTTIDKYN